RFRAIDPINRDVLRFIAHVVSAFRRTVVAVAIAIAILPACTRSANKPQPGAIQPTYDSKTGKLVELAYDSDHDGKPDTWTEMDGARPLRTRIDRNGDGKIDRWEEYDASGALVKVGFSRRDDGKADAWMSPRGADGLQRIEISSTANEQKI